MTHTSLPRDADTRWNKVRPRAHMAPIVWRVEWPQDMKDALMTWDNPHGTITNSDLEMAAELLGWLVLESIETTQPQRRGRCEGRPGDQ